ncbi:endo- -beta-mannosidase [Moniliophthora roreri MCA 2997]|uniref:mannan endo-1,4-beta-mannosidase n=1 Tax=Moniliophthora roreri (strain MCA 2997) TaxID=1381753 RepID=V2YC96_MONRO|nr:endo- -beta-mannosidase [Moniliophthora roreri MCA 2997]
MLRSLLQASLLLLGLFQIAVSSQSKPPKGFATTHNDRFEVDGKEFYFVGANSYWLPLLTSQEDVKSTFKEMKNAGIKVLRTWGFNAINGTELEGANRSGLTYYQVWNSSEWVLNDGPQGLERLDYVLEQAAAHDIKVILTFTNNCLNSSRTQGMEFYVNWIAGAEATHDVFFTDSRVRRSYQRYVKTIVERYKDSPTIFAWELMNEARCRGDIPGGPNCVPGSGTLTKWYKEQADFVRSLDPHHMITTGGEGHFYWKEAKWASDYNFNGQAGEDFDTDLALENIDFGTYHMYPQFW